MFPGGAVVVQMKHYPAYTALAVRVASERLAPCGTDVHVHIALRSLTLAAGSLGAGCLAAGEVRDGFALRTFVLSALGFFTRILP